MWIQLPQLVTALVARLGALGAGVGGLTVVYDAGQSPDEAPP